MNELQKTVSNGSADAFVKELHAQPLHKEAGVLELVFCVAGIYASLYVSTLFPYDT